MNNNATYSANSNGLTERFERNTGGANPSIQGANKTVANTVPRARALRRLLPAASTSPSTWP